jgi:hypothetical protein
MHASSYVCTYECLFARTRYVFIFVSMHVCMCVGMYACMYVSSGGKTLLFISKITS